MINTPILNSLKEAKDYFGLAYLPNNDLKPTKQTLVPFNFSTTQILDIADQAFDELVRLVKQPSPLSERQIKQLKSASETYEFFRRYFIHIWYNEDVRAKTPSMVQYKINNYPHIISQLTQATKPLIRSYSSNDISSLQSGKLYLHPLIPLKKEKMEPTSQTNEQPNPSNWLLFKEWWNSCLKSLLKLLFRT